MGKKLNKHISVIVIWIALIVGTLLVISNLSGEIFTNPLAALAFLPLVFTTFIPLIFGVTVIGIAVTVHIYVSSKTDDSSK